MMAVRGGAWVDVNRATGKSGWRPLHHALEGGHTGVVKALLGTHAVDVNLLDRREKETALAVGARRGHVDAVRLLLEHVPRNGLEGVKPNERDRQGRTPLALAAKGGYTDIVRDLAPLVGRGALGEADKRGVTALHLASLWGHTSVVETLVGLNRKLADAADPKGRTSLLLAARRGHVGVVRALVGPRGGGCNVNARLSRGGEMGESALMLAARRGHAGVVAELLRDGALDVNGPKTRRGNTALMLAVLDGHWESVQHLLRDPRTDLSPTNNDGLDAHGLARRRVKQTRGGESAMRVLHAFESKAQAEADAAERQGEERRERARIHSLRRGQVMGQRRHPIV